MKQSKFPPGWNEKRVKKVLAYYENQSEEESVAEDEAAFEGLDSLLDKTYMEEKIFKGEMYEDGKRNCRRD